jgi:hypothetical protein
VDEVKAEDAISEVATPWAVICPRHGQVFMNADGYFRQMDFTDSKWICPKCGANAEWDDENFEARDGDGS